VIIPHFACPSVQSSINPEAQRPQLGRYLNIGTLVITEVKFTVSRRRIYVPFNDIVNS
jgi:hypothetical protein